MLNKYNTKILDAYCLHSIRLQPYRRFQRPIYKIVIVNPKNRIVTTLGYYNPFKIKFRTTYRKLLIPMFSGKVVAIDRTSTLLWLSKGVIPSTTFLCFLLYDMGLLKTHLSSHDEKYFQFKNRVNKILPLLIDDLLSY